MLGRGTVPTLRRGRFSGSRRMLGEGALSPLSYPPLATEEHTEGLLDGLHPDETDFTLLVL